MTESSINPLSKKSETLRQYDTGIAQSLSLLHWLGYGLLLFAGLDLVQVFIPPNLTNPAWELQTFGAIIERIAVPLLGLGLIFLGGRDGRPTWEFPVLKGLSWLALVASVLLLLAIPLGIINTIRIDRQNSAQVTAQVQQKKAQIQAVQGQLGNASTASEMEALLAQLDSSVRFPDIEAVQLEATKQEISSVLEQGANSLDAQAKAVRNGQRLTLLKSSVRWNVGALIGSALFLLIWLMTDWTRRSR